MKLNIQNLSAAYDDDVVLDGLSLEVKEGEFVSLLGPSGCGKSTLIKAVAGIVQPKYGSIILGGADITNLPIHKRGTVVLFQDMRLFPHLRVDENVAFPLKMQGVPKAERLSRARELLKLVQLEGLEHRRPNELSGGQQQRAALARSLAAQPRLLLLDEPFSALDENLREEMRQLVLSLHRQFNMTTILVTHDREEALSMSDRVAVMFGGKILQMDTPQRVYKTPSCKAVADYFGDCTYARGKVQSGVFTTAGISIKANAEDGEYLLLLRPNDFEISKDGTLPVTVESVRFRGSDTLVTFKAAGLTFGKAFAAAPDLQAGDTLFAKLKVEVPVLFKVEK